MKSVLLTEAGLAKVGIHLLTSPLALQCRRCGEEWLVKLKASGYLPTDWWHCPNGCNKPAHNHQPG